MRKGCASAQICQGRCQSRESSRSHGLLILNERKEGEEEGDDFGWNGQRDDSNI
jgi:hypothetical protein